MRSVGEKLKNFGCDLYQKATDILPKRQLLLSLIGAGIFSSFLPFAGARHSRESELAQGPCTEGTPFPQFQGCVVTGEATAGCVPYHCFVPQPPGVKNKTTGPKWSRLC